MIPEHLISEWDYEKNVLDPLLLKPNSHKKVWWKCKENHSWDMIVKDRTQKKQKCPYCSNKRINNTNSFASKFPELLKEWNDKKIDPNKVSPYSGKKVLWKCSLNHEWKTEIRVRAAGSGCPYCSGNKALPETSFSFIHPQLLKEWDYDKNKIKPNEIKSQANINIHWICNKGHKWKTFLYNRTLHKSSCPKCRLTSGHLEICQFLTENNIVFEVNNKTAINPLELDIFIPSNNFAIEYNGLYWHSENKINKEYHSNKTIQCSQKHIQLFHIFSDEWRFKQDIVKSMILHKLNLSSKKIPARKCSIMQVPFREEKEFFNKNHISGYVASKICYGLYYCGKLMAAISMKKPIQKKYENSIEILRFASELNYSIVGGFSKLFKKCIEYAKFHGFQQIISYSDLRFGNGNVYIQNGFKLIGKTSLDYWYSDGITREGRFKYRAKDNKSEKQIAKENNVYKIYGCGHLIYQCPIV